MTSVTITTNKNTVTVDEDNPSVITVATQGPQGPMFPDGDAGDITVGNSGTTLTIDAGVVNNAKIASDAAIALSKLATGPLPTGITVASANIPDLTIVNADISASAAIAGTKISPDFGSQNIVTTGTIASNDITISDANPSVRFVDSDNDSDFAVLINSGLFKIKDSTNNTDRFKIASDGTVEVLGNLDVGAGLDVTGDITVTGTVDGVDIANGLVKNGNTDQGQIQIRANDADFIIQDGTDGVTNFIWRDHSAGKLYLGTDAAVVTPRSHVIPSVDSTYDLGVNGTRWANIYGDTIHAGSLTVDQDLTVNGTTTTINTANLDVEDKNITLAKVSTPTDTTADGGGITIKGATDKTFNWVNSTDAFTSSEHIHLEDNKKLLLGTETNKTEIYHNNNDGVIDEKQRDLYIKNSVADGQIIIKTDGNFFLSNAAQNEYRIKAYNNGKVELLYDDSTKLETTSTGTTTTGQSLVDTGTSLNGATQYNGQNFGLVINSNQGNANGAGGNGICFAQRYDTTDTAKIRTGAIIGYKDAGTGGFGGGLKLKVQQAGANPLLTALKLKANGDVQIPADSQKLQLGSSQDLSLYHDGSNSYIANTAGTLLIRADNLDLRPNTNSGEVYLRCTQNGSVQLRYDSSSKLETTATGANIFGRMNMQVDDSTTYPTDWGTKAYSAYDHELVIDNNTQGNEGSFAGIYFNAGAHSDGSKVGTARISAVETGNHSADLVFATRNVGFSEKVRITSGGNLRIPNDSGKLQLGASQDLELYHNGSHSYIHDGGTGDLRITGSAIHLQDSTQSANMLKAFEGDRVELLFDGSKKLQTTSGGILVDGDIHVVDDKKLLVGTGNDLQIYHDETNSIIESTTGFLKVTGNSGNLYLQSDNKVWLTSHNAGATLARFIEGAENELYYDGVEKFQTTSDGVQVLGKLLVSGPSSYLSSSSSTHATLTLKKNNTDADAKDYLELRDSNNDLKLEITGSGNVNLIDSAKLQLGDSQDLSIYHNGTDTYIDNNTNVLFIQSDVLLLEATNGENFVKSTAGSSVKIYYDNALKLETLTAGVQVWGHLRIPDSDGTTDKLEIGNSQDLTLYHDGTHSRIKNDTGGLYIHVDNGEFLNRAGDEVIAKFLQNSRCELYWDNSKKLETTSAGATVTTTNAANSIRNITTSTSAPSGGSDGDLWFTYT